MILPIYIYHAVYINVLNVSLVFCPSASKEKSRWMYPCIFAGVIAGAIALGSAMYYFSLQSYTEIEIDTANLKTGQLFSTRSLYLFFCFHITQSLHAVLKTILL